MHTLVSSLAWVMSVAFSFSIAEIAFSFSDISWILESKFCLMSLLFWMSLSLDWTLMYNNKIQHFKHFAKPWDIFLINETHYMIATCAVYKLVLDMILLAS